MAEQAFGPVAPETLAAFDRVCAEVEGEVLRLCLAEDDPWKTMGPNAENMIKTGLGFVSKMLRASLSFSAGEILADQMQWGKTRLPEYGVSAGMVLGNFERYAKALSEKLPQGAFVEIQPYLEHMLSGQRGIASSGE